MKKVLKITAVTTLLSLGLAFSSYAGQWKQGTGANAGKWWYDEDNGTYATNGSVSYTHLTLPTNSRV